MDYWVNSPRRKRCADIISAPCGRESLLFNKVTWPTAIQLISPIASANVTHLLAHVDEHGLVARKGAGIVEVRRALLSVPLVDQ